MPIDISLLGFCIIQNMLVKSSTKKKKNQNNKEATQTQKANKN